MVIKIYFFLKKYKSIKKYIWRPLLLLVLYGRGVKNLNINYSFIAVGQSNPKILWKRQPFILKHLLVGGGKVFNFTAATFTISMKRCKWNIKIIIHGFRFSSVSCKFSFRNSKLFQTPFSQYFLAVLKLWLAFKYKPFSKLGFMGYFSQMQLKSWCKEMCRLKKQIPVKWLAPQALLSLQATQCALPRGTQTRSRGWNGNLNHNFSKFKTATLPTVALIK